MEPVYKNLGKVRPTIDNNNWSINNKYDLLTIVYDPSSNKSYISRKDVPTNIVIDNREYWLPFGVGKFVDNAIININYLDGVSQELVTYTLEEAIARIGDEDKRLGVIISFYGNEASDSHTPGWCLYQFMSDDLNDWDNINAWNSIYYNRNKNVGWFRTESELLAIYPFPHKGDYCYIGTSLINSFVYRCYENGTWANTHELASANIGINIGGNIRISNNGTWIVDNEDTGIKAVGTGIDRITYSPSQEDGGINLLQIKLTDGSRFNFPIKNGNQGNSGIVVPNLETFLAELVNNLTTNDSTKALSAAQGVILNNKIGQLGQELSSGASAFTLLIDSERISIEQGSINSEGKNISNVMRLRTKDAISTNFGIIGVPNGFLIQAVFYYSSWTDATHYAFDTFNIIGKQSLILDDAYSYARLIIRNVEDTDIVPQDLISVLPLISPNIKEQITKLERGAKYIGIANKDTVPTITGINMFAFACTPGVYVNFDGIELMGGELATLYYNSLTQSWTKQTLRLNSVILNRFVTSINDSAESNKTISLPGFYIYPEGNDPFFLMRMNNRNTADNVTLNVNNTGAKPLFYKGTQMSSINSPNYANAYFIVFYVKKDDIYVTLEIPKGLTLELGDDNSIAISQAGLKSILTSQWFTNFHSKTHFYEGYVLSAGHNAGNHYHSDVVIVSQGLTGYVRIKTKNPYCISSGYIYNADGTPNRSFGVGTISAGKSYSFYLDPTKEFARLNVRNIDPTQPISPDYDFLDYCYIDIDEKRIVDGHSLFNIAIKELYLNGADVNKDYYISSLSKGNSDYVVSSLVVREKVSGDIVAQYYKTDTPNPPAFIKLIEQNNSGISGLALIDWFLVENGALITNTEQYNVLDSVHDINKCPQLSLYLNSAQTRLIDSLSLVADDGVIHTAWNYILKDVTIDNVRYLQFSNDLGETFTQAENIYGDIVYVHFFSNGVCLFATANKCYYFSNIEDIQESVLVDYDGSLYVSNCVLDFFQNDQSRNDAMIVGGKEIVIWGNYSLGGQQDPNYIGRVWYSADYGATVKCAIKFGTTVISGETTIVRHVHGALYNKYNEKFIIITGDVGNECQIIEGIYNPTIDSWQFTKLGQGDQFKFGDVLFRENFVYLVTDYTLDASIYPRGILRVPYEMLNDYSKYQYICKVERYTGSLISTLEDENGNKLLFPDGLGAGKIWYCKHNFKFVQIPMSESVVITNVGSPNYNGEIYARKSQGLASFPFKLSPMVNLTKSMRNSGCIDFFVQDNVLL